MTMRPPRGLVSNTLASAGATLWIAALTVVSVPVLIRLLGVREYGVWVLVTVIAVQGRGLGSLLDLGLGQSLIQRVAATEDREQAARHVGAGVRLLGAVGTLAAAVLVVAASPLVHLFSIKDPAAITTATTAVRFLALQLIVELPGVALGSGLEGLRRYEVRRTIDAARATAFFAGAIAIAAAGGSVAGLAAWSLATTVASTVALAVACGGSACTSPAAARCGPRRGPGCRSSRCVRPASGTASSTASSSASSSPRSRSPASTSPTRSTSWP